MWLDEGSEEAQEARSTTYYTRKSQSYSSQQEVMHMDASSQGGGARG